MLERCRKGTGLWQIWMENHPRAISIWICPHNLSDQGVWQHEKSFCHRHTCIKATNRHLFQISKMKDSQHGKYLSEITPQNSDVIYNPHELGLQWTDLVTLKYLLVWTASPLPHKALWKSYCHPNGCKVTTVLVSKKLHQYSSCPE